MKETSQAQIDANRANAIKSTGPITPAGKATVAFNARKHGLCAKQLVLTNESQTDFKFLLDGYIERFQPVNPVELELVNTMAAARWRLRRLLRVETGLLANELVLREKEVQLYLKDATFDQSLASAFKTLSDRSQGMSMLVRHEGSLTRAHDRAFRQLEALRSPKKSPTTKQSQFPPTSKPETPDESAS